MSVGKVKFLRNHPKPNKWISLIEYQSDQCLGIRTRARIAKGVKEDPKKREPRKINKDKKYINSGLRDERFRVISSMGGQSNNPLSAKPKIFRHFQTLKRKKLYRPKKHCVRIQIPRKGYFYRSTVQFKAPGSAPSLQRVESTMPKSKSKVQIPGMAPTSPKIPNLLKKRLKKGKNIQPVGSQAKVPKQRSPTRVAHLSFAQSGKVYNFDEKVSEYVASKLAGSRSFSSNEGKSSEKFSSDQEEERLYGAVLENSVSCSNSKTKRIFKRKLKSNKKQTSSKGPDDKFDILETASERIISASKRQIQASDASKTSFETLIRCINRMLGKDEGYYDLEITPVRTGRGEFSVEEDQDLLATEAVTAFEGFHDTADSQEEPTPVPPEPQISSHFQNDGDHPVPSEDDIVNILIGELDLHLELENYLETIDTFAGAKNKFKNALQGSACEDFYSLNGSNPDIPTVTDETDVVTESKSISTFVSAISVCVQQDENSKKLQKFFERRYDIPILSDELFDSPSPKNFNSETQLSDMNGYIGEIKPNSDSNKIYQDSKVKSSIKRLLEKTSFHSLHSNDENSFLPPYLEAELTADGSMSSYEKIQAFGMSSNNSCEEIKSFGSSNYQNSASSLSTELFLPNTRKDSFDSEKFHYENDSSDSSDSDDQSMQLSIGRTSSRHSITSDTSQLGSKWHWSPTLQELIEIYNSVLKQNNKFRKNSRTSVSKCLSSHLFSFLNEKLKEKEYKAKLLMLSKALKERVKTPEAWKPGRSKSDNSLKEYVAIFQEILQSSLTISQITRLNKTISDLQKFSEKNFDIVKNMKQLKKKKEKTEQEQTEALTKPEIICEPKTEPKSQTLPFVSKKSKMKDAIKGAVKREKSLVERSEVKRQKVQDEKQKTVLKPSESSKDMTNVELSLPTTLEAILQSSLKVDGTDKKNNAKGFNDKILVNVELSGNQVLVNRLSYFKNEETLTSTKNKKNGTSELIIENVTKDQVNDEQMKTKSSKNNSKLSDQNELNKCEKPKTKGRGKSHKKNKNRPKTAKAAAATADKKVKESRVEKDDYFRLEEIQNYQIPKRFEYDQILLRAQHPIEAIIESSESKISEVIESSDDDRPGKFLSDKIFFQTTIQSESEPKKSLSKVLGGNVFSKDLYCDLGWSGDILNKSTYTINRKTPKKIKGTKTVKSLLDLKNNCKSKRKGRRLISSYTCFPSIPTSERTASKKKSIKQFKQNIRPSFSNSQSLNCGLVTQPNEMIEKCSKELYASNFRLDIVNSEQDKIEILPDQLAVLVSKEAGLDCCSSEFLYDTRNFTTKIIPRGSALKSKHFSRASLDRALVPVENGSNSSAPGCAISSNEVKESPVVIYPSKGVSESLSNSTINIHSDSFLKCIPLTLDNYCFLFKSSSDIRFYPGRICSEEQEKSPFVKFVLTPRQNADADLPPEQVEVVDKKQTAENSAVVDDSSEKEGAKTASEDSNEEVSLVSIEKFIKKLSTHKKKAKSKKSKKSDSKGNTTATVATKACQMNKTSNPKSHLKMTDRKPYHECQMRKLVEKKKKLESKPKSADSKLNTKESTSNPKESKPNKKESKSKLRKEKSPAEATADNAGRDLISLKSLISVFSKIISSYESFSKDKAKIQLLKKCRTEPEEAFTSPNILSHKRAERHLEKGTNTIPELKCSLSRVLDSSVESPQRVKSAITQTDDLSHPRNQIVPEPENHCVKQPITCENSTCISKFSSETTLPRKSKMLKIKIHCENHKHSTKAAKIAEIQYDPEKEKNKLQSKAEEVEPLDLTAKDQEVGTLKRRDSTYFDATDNSSDEESKQCKTERKAHPKQKEYLTYWTTVDGGGLNAAFAPAARIFSCNAYPEGSLELLLDEIQKSLQNNKICYSLTLLDDFFLQAECSPSWSDNLDKLKKTLLTADCKSKNLTKSLEKNAWLKVFFLLEELYEMVKSEGVDTRALIEKFQGRKDKRLTDLQKICSSLSQTTCKKNGRAKNVMGRITDSLRYFKSKILVKRSPSSECCRNQKTAEPHFPHVVYWTTSLPDISEDFTRSLCPLEESPFLQLRKQIQQRKKYIEFLLSSGCEYVSQEIQDAKAKVVEKMRFFERLFLILDKKCNVK